ncbi:PQQ-dependent sugar dehydrogenase [Candidatus Woesebacteria bacterium]|nr:PQQ-dependent sugar dehydrogenase [Candidatus Woesebacteria bacterium]
MRKILVILLLALAVIFISKQLGSKTTSQLDGGTGGQQGRQGVKVPSRQTEAIASNLEIPWELEFLPDGRMFVTERPGRLLLIGGEKKNYEVKEVAHIGEGGLLGMALDPDFTKNNFLYLYFTYRNGGQILNKVQRFVFKNESLIEDKVIIDKIPGSNNHDGGRIKFGPDGALYITTGDAQETGLAQDLNSLAGKILRYDGEKVEVYSYGHRNPQGLAWDTNGNLWATEHGPSTKDEINLVKKGSNYGWPTITGNQAKAGMETPIINSGSDTWAPSGAVISDDKLYFAGLRGQAVYSMDLKTKELKKSFAGEFGRIRSVNLGPDGSFYIITSNRDGRNPFPNASDDRIIRITDLSQ